MITLFILNFRLEWILIGCKHFIVHQLEKNNRYESDPNNIVLLYFYRVDDALQQFSKNIL